uniref:HUWE1-associated protein modifying stress responses 1 isoform X1 n=1 Tax=Myxine glutinosa TaxID=7769 RepID=UPI0035900534
MTRRIASWPIENRRRRDCGSRSRIRPRPWPSSTKIGFVSSSKECPSGSRSRRQHQRSPLCTKMGLKYIDGAMTMAFNWAINGGLVTSLPGSKSDVVQSAEKILLASFVESPLLLYTKHMLEVVGQVGGSLPLHRRHVLPSRTLATQMIQTSSPSEKQLHCMGFVVKSLYLFPGISTMPLTVEQKTKVVALWYEIKSYVDIHWRFCQEYDLRTRDGPTNCAIQRIVKHFEHKGTVHNQSKGNSGRPASVTKSQANIDAVRDSAVDSPKKSHRRCSQDLGIKPTSVWRILTKELKLFPYIISIRHKLSQDDMRRRLDMCNWLSDRMERYPNWINLMWFSDEGSSTTTTTFSAGQNHLRPTGKFDRTLESGSMYV